MHSQVNPRLSRTERDSCRPEQVVHFTDAYSRPSISPFRYFPGRGMHSWISSGGPDGRPDPLGECQFLRPLYAAEKHHEPGRVDAPACSPSKLLRRIDAARLNSGFECQQPPRPQRSCCTPEWRWSSTTRNRNLALPNWPRPPQTHSPSFKRLNLNSSGDLPPTATAPCRAGSPQIDS
jgi:hypothetical protein